MKKATLLFALTGGLVCGASAGPLSLAGQWRFQLDRADAGENERWFARALPDRVTLPGGLTEQGIGDPPSLTTKWLGRLSATWHREVHLAPYITDENFKFPYWLTPDLYYAGAAWYQRDIQIPDDWAGKRVVLSLERPHWETRVWLGGRLIGTNNALATPHEYDLGQVPSGKHTLTIRVDNRMIIDIGENSHSVSDHTQGNWNGIVGRIELRATPLVWIEDVRVYPNVANKSVRVVVASTNGTPGMFAGKLTLSFEANGKPTALPVSRNFGSAEADLTTEDEVKLGPEALLWDEFSPQLYSVRAELRGELDGQLIESVRTVTFGLREISTQGTQFLINGRKTFFRGTLECAIFPKSGHPPTDVDSWKRIIQICQAHGLNMIRFHSWCPPEAAFIAADELGFYFQVEASSWANQSTTLGDGKPVDAWIYAETDRILKHYGNHPSFLLMAYGNEPGGPNHKAFLSEYLNHYKPMDSRRLWTSGAGWPQLPENEFHVTPDPRVQGWGEGLKSRINGRAPETMTDYRDYIAARAAPVISHEIGQWCVYPNFDEIEKYTGYLKPRNFEIFRDTLRARHMGDQARQFLLASGKLQTLCYKEDIESALRTPGMGGFQLLDLHDFPGQGTALVGVLDPFWESKGYVTAGEFSRFCNRTVPLARLARRVFTTEEHLEAALEVAHFGADPLKNAVTEWKLVDDAGKVHVSGKLPAKTLPIDNAIPLGKISAALRGLPAPAKYKLVVALRSGDPAASRVEGGSGINAAFQTNVENDWDIWVYPPKVDTAIPSGITVVDQLDDAAIATLNAGGNVLWFIPPKRVAGDPGTGRVALGFSSIFWNTAWTRRQPPHTLGILCDPKHPLFESFPTEFHSNWQWWYLVSRAGAMILDQFPAELRPSVQVIDDWFTNRKLGLVLEARVGKGKLVVCSIDLESELESDPVRRQFRHSLLRYMNGGEFNPAVNVSVEQLQTLTSKPSPLTKLGLRSITASSEEDGHEAENAIDGDPNTIWHTPWRSGSTRHPHHLKLEFKAPITLRGFTSLPRQDGIRNGWICDYAFYASDDGVNWGEPVKRGTFEATKDLKTVMFKRPVRGRFFMFVALSGFVHSPLGSMAEFSVLEDADESSNSVPVSPSDICDAFRGEKAVVVGDGFEPSKA